MFSIDSLFVAVVFDEHVRRGKSGGGNTREMDFESFLDFVLALENKDTPEGLTYLFRCLDLHGKSHLTTADVHTLFRYNIYYVNSLIPTIMQQYPVWNFAHILKDILNSHNRHAIIQNLCTELNATFNFYFYEGSIFYKQFGQHNSKIIKILFLPQMLRTKKKRASLVTFKFEVDLSLVLITVLRLFLDD